MDISEQCCVEAPACSRQSRIYAFTGRANGAGSCWPRHETIDQTLPLSGGRPRKPLKLLGESLYDLSVGGKLTARSCV